MGDVMIQSRGRIMRDEWVRKSMKVVNLLMLLFGIGIIIYSLWLQKKWDHFVLLLRSLSPSLSLPTPWFIYTSFGVGIAVCLSTFGGHMVANFVSNPTICLYIVMICCLLFSEVAVIVAIFFKLDWTKQIAEDMDDAHQEFQAFVVFHVKTCRVIMCLIMGVQVNTVILSVVLWTIGTEPRTQCGEGEDGDVPHFTQSFLVPNSPVVLHTPQAPTTFSAFGDENSPRGILSNIISFLRFRSRFLRRNVFD